MNLDEFNKVKDFNYDEYCDYLQHKYGIGLDNYMTPSYTVNPKCKRTGEGLVVHHKAEDKMILLSKGSIAKDFPYEWQSKENIVYCDYLEHLMLHVLICQYPSIDREWFYKGKEIELGIGGILDYIVPELNDVYSGWIANQNWQRNCHNRIVNDKDVYFRILTMFIGWYKREKNEYDTHILHTSIGDRNGCWNRQENALLYSEIDRLWGDDLQICMLVQDDWRAYIDLDIGLKTKEVTLAVFHRSVSGRRIKGFPLPAEGQALMPRVYFESEDVIKQFLYSIPINVITDIDVVSKLVAFMPMGVLLRNIPKSALTPPILKYIVDKSRNFNSDFNIPDDVFTFDWWKYTCYKHGYYNALHRRSDGFPENIWEQIKCDGKETPEAIWDRIIGQ